MNTHFRFRSWLVFGALALGAQPFSSLFAIERKTTFGLLSENYVNQHASSPGDRNTYSRLAGDLQLETHNSILQGVFDGQGALALDNSKTNYLLVRESYLGTSPQLGRTKDGQSVGFHVGRKLEHWNQLDEYWRLGLWQPRFRYDHLNPELVGLTGFFARYEHPMAQVVVFGSPIYLPEMGAPVSVQNGSVVAFNRFVSPPPSTGNFLQRNTPIQYTLHTPPIEQIVMNPEAGGLVRIGAKSGPWGQAAYHYKPMNQILIGYEAVLDSTDRTAKVDLYPRLVYHHLFGGDLGFKSDEWQVWGSAVLEEPTADRVAPGMTVQQVTRATVLSSGGEMSVVGRGDSAIKVNAGYLRLWGGFAPDRGLRANGSGSLFEPRYPYREAGTIGLNAPFWMGGQSTLRLKSQYTQDFVLSGHLISSEVLYSPTRAWTIAFGADVIGIDGSMQSVELGGGPDFINRNRANDRVRGGISYVF